MYFEAFRDFFKIKKITAIEFRILEPTLVNRKHLRILCRNSMHVNVIGVSANVLQQIPVPLTDK
jgi:hypothetical protein